MQHDFKKVVKMEYLRKENVPTYCKTGHLQSGYVTCQTCTRERIESKDNYLFFKNGKKWAGIK